MECAGTSLYAIYKVSVVCCCESVIEDWRHSPRNVSGRAGNVRQIRSDSAAGATLEWQR